MKNFGNLAKLIFESNGVAPEVAEGEIGVGARTIYNWFKAERVPPRSNADVKLSDFFLIPLHVLRDAIAGKAALPDEYLHRNEWKRRRAVYDASKGADTGAWSIGIRIETDERGKSHYVPSTVKGKRPVDATDLLTAFFDCPDVQQRTAVRQLDEAERTKFLRLIEFVKTGEKPTAAPGRPSGARAAKPVDPEGTQAMEMVDLSSDAKVEGKRQPASSKRRGRH